MAVAGDAPGSLLATTPYTGPGYIKPQNRPPHDPTITFEEYHYYALRTREKELALEPPKLKWREWMLRKKDHADEPVSPDPSESAAMTARKGTSDAEQSQRMEITDQEWENANRALRTASTGACKCFFFSSPFFCSGSLRPQLKLSSFQSITQASI